MLVLEVGHKGLSTDPVAVGHEPRRATVDAEEGAPQDGQTGRVAGRSAAPRAILDVVAKGRDVLEALVLIDVAHAVARQHHLEVVGVFLVNADRTIWDGMSE